MSDLANYAKLAKSIMDEMRRIEGMAIPGTVDHWQFVSTGLMQRWHRIRFCLEALDKQQSK